MSEKPTSYISKEMIILVSVIGAAAVAYSGNDGWGWLIFLAILLAL